MTVFSLARQSFGSIIDLHIRHGVFGHLHIRSWPCMSSASSTGATYSGNIASITGYSVTSISIDFSFLLAIIGSIVSYYDTTTSSCISSPDFAQNEHDRRKAAAHLIVMPLDIISLLSAKATRLLIAGTS